jgi:uncharacterized protein DUF4381
MDGDRYSLGNLRDIFIPEPPPLWPPAPGVWVALGMIFVVLLLVGWYVYSVRKRNAYRQAGLALLQNAATAHDVVVVVKRVALAVFPREQVASLYGEDWIAFLDESCPGSHFTAMLGTDQGAVPDGKLIAHADTWIRHHRVPEPRPMAAVK